MFELFSFNPSAWISAKKIKFVNCNIEGTAYPNSYFLSSTSNFVGPDAIDITSSKLINCTKFIENPKELQINNCIIINPGQDFLQCGFSSIAATIENCLFEYKDTPDFIDLEKGCLDAHKITLSHCSFEDIPKKNSWWWGAFIKGKYIHFQFCNFNKCHTLCINKGEGEITAEWCVYNNCSKIFSADQQEKLILDINHCQFNECYHQLILCVKSNISDCEFNNWIGDDITSPQGTLLCIESGKPECNSNHIQRCTFNNANANLNFLIAAKTMYSKTTSYVANVHNCTFNNCITKRESGKLIKHYAPYQGAFKITKDIQVINSDNGKYTSDKVAYTVMETTPLGEKIGCSLSSDISISSTTNH